MASRARIPPLLVLTAALDLFVRAVAAFAPRPVSTSLVVAAFLATLLFVPLVGICFVRLVLLPGLARRPALVWPARFLMLLAGVAIVAAVWNRFIIEATDVDVRVGPLFEVAVLGINLVVVAAFTTVGDGGAALAARLATFRSKLLFVGLAGAGSALVLYNLGADFGVLRDLNPPLRTATIGFFAGSIVYGLCAAIAARLAAWFADAVNAVEALGRGDLSARMPDSARDETGALARAFNRAVADRREAQLVERAFGQYVGADILASIRQSGRGFLAAERCEATVLYADVRGFTKFSESETPEEVMRILNIYFARMVEVIAAHGGHVDKFIGDALMVTFNVPVSHPDHATRAATCGVEIQAALARLNASEAFGAGRVLEVGIGVNTGELVAGSLGSEGKAQYTVIGDTVNIAARLTSAAKAGEVLAGERTADAARSATHLVFDALAPLTLKGKAQPVPAWRCTGKA